MGKCPALSLVLVIVVLENYSVPAMWIGIVLGVVGLFVANAMFIKHRLQRLGRTLELMEKQGMTQEGLVVYLQSEGYTPEMIGPCLRDIQKRGYISLSLLQRIETMRA